MRKTLLRVALVFTVILSLSAVGHAGTIYNVIPPPSTYGTGQGTGNLFSANFGYSGSFQTFRSYSNISGQIILSANGWSPEVTMSIAKASPTGEIGTILSSTSFTVVGSGPVGFGYGIPAIYDFEFTGLTLDDASTYYLVTSTTAVATGPGGVAGLPRAYQAVVSHSTRPFHYAYPFASLAFAIFGTEIGDPIANGGPVPVIGTSIYAAPEPSVLWMLGIGLAVLLAIGHRKRSYSLR